MVFYKRLLKQPDNTFLRKTDQQTSKALSLEFLEARLALDSSGLTRPQLEQAATIHIDASLGPNPIVFTKSELVGQETNSFIITSVAEGSVVEKWNQVGKAKVFCPSPPKALPYSEKSEVFWATWSIEPSQTAQPEGG